MKTILILGIGNLLMGDEGFGVHAADALAKIPLPSHVSVLDGGTGGFHLLTHLESFDHIIMIDATLDNKPAGTIQKIKPRFASDFPKAMSTHDIGLRDLVVTMQLLGRIPEIDLIVVSIASIQQQGVYLSPEAENALKKVVELIVEMVE